MSRNPNWTRDEVILALKLYAKSEYSKIDTKDHRVVALSKLLNKLPIHPTEVRDKNFHNPNGVGLKLGNFAHLDPDYHGEGMKACSNVDRRVFVEFWHNKQRLFEAARTIRGHSAQFSTPRTKADAERGLVVAADRLADSARLSGRALRNEMEIRARALVGTTRRWFNR